MNEIILRTNKGEYFPGDDVYGVIYLNIANPTAGRGVKLKFEGFEHIFYHSTVDNKEYKFRDFKHYIDCTDVTLYTSDGPSIGLGSYCFPFKVTLLSDIPGSFSAESCDDVKWEAKVVYWLKAELIDADSIYTTQVLVVHHPPPSGVLPNDPPLAVNTKLEIPHMLFFKKKLFITAKLTKQVWQAGDVAKLKVIITNETGIDVSCIKMKLCRELFLLTRGYVEDCKDTQVKVNEEKNKLCIKPEGTEPVVVWENTIQGCSQAVLNKGIDEIWIPLSHRDGTPLLTSVSGHHTQCYYYIDIDVSLLNSHTASVRVPVYCLIHPKHKEWYDWQPPDWVYQTEVITMDSRFSVSEIILRSNAFSSFPRFQALNFFE